jgi:hypothetical protein
MLYPVELRAERKFQETDGIVGFAFWVRRA